MESFIFTFRKGTILYLGIALMILCSCGQQKQSAWEADDTVIMENSGSEASEIPMKNETEKTRKTDMEEDIASENEALTENTEISENDDSKEEENMVDNIEVFTQNSIRIKSSAGTIYIDPFQMKEEPHDADFILVTHDHYDHYSPEDIKKAAGDNTVFIAPEKMKNKIKEISGLMKKVETVVPGSDYEFEGLELETVPAYNIVKPFHPKSSKWVGYVLKLDEKRIYVAGDTDATDEAKAVNCDIALIPIGGTYTMDAKEGANLINLIKPSVAIPTHYGNIVGSPKDGEVFRENVDDPVSVELKIKF